MVSEVTLYGDVVLRYVSGTWQVQSWDLSGWSVPLMIRFELLGCSLQCDNAFVL